MVRDGDKALPTPDRISVERSGLLAREKLEKPNRKAEVPNVNSSVTVFYIPTDDIHRKSKRFADVLCGKPCTRPFRHVQSADWVLILPFLPSRLLDSDGKSCKPILPALHAA